MPITITIVQIHERSFPVVQIIELERISLSCLIRTRMMCFLTAVQFAQLQTKIEKLIKSDEDSIRMYVLDAGSVKRTITYAILLG